MKAIRPPPICVNVATSLSFTHWTGACACPRDLDCGFKQIEISVGTNRKRAVQATASPFTNA